jgi:phytoene dehydrogenase-like protein
MMIRKALKYKPAGRTMR